MIKKFFSNINLKKKRNLIDLLIDFRFADFGTMLEVRDIQFFPDGRSIVDTMGGRRFKVIERGVMDGYNTAKVEFLEDEKVPEDQVQGG